MTRREWVLQLGGGVVLAGWSAADLDAAELPPGVYLPSRDHLSHALAGRELASGSETELSRKSEPAFFKPAEYRAIQQLTAQLLGESLETPIVNEVAQWIDLTVSESAGVRKAALALTPAHRTLAVHFYGDKTVQQLERLDPQAICREGLAYMDSGKSLGDMADDHTENAGTRFFDYLKRCVTEGFYTSRLGLEELGRGNPSFYASPPGCPG